MPVRCVNAELIFGSGCFPEIRRSGAECLMELDAADECEVEGAEGIHLVLFKLLHLSFHFHSLPHWEHLMIPKLGPSCFPSFRFQLNTCPPALYLVINSSKARSSLCSLVISPGCDKYSAGVLCSKRHLDLVILRRICFKLETCLPHLRHHIPPLSFRASAWPLELRRILSSGAASGGLLGGSSFKSSE